MTTEPQIFYVLNVYASTNETTGLEQILEVIPTSSAELVEWKEAEQNYDRARVKYFKTEKEYHAQVPRCLRSNAIYTESDAKPMPKELKQGRLRKAMIETYERLRPQARILRETATAAHREFIKAADINHEVSDIFYAHKEVYKTTLAMTDGVMSEIPAGYVRVEKKGDEQ